MLTEANEYFSNRLWTEDWDNENDTVKKKALSHAENQLNVLNILEDLEDEKQNIAIFEQAIFLLGLDEEDKERLRLQSENVESINISGGVSENYNLEKGSNILLSPIVKDLIEAEEVGIESEKEYVIGDLT